MSSADHIAFENDQPVQSVEFVYPDEVEPGEAANTSGIVEDALQILDGGLQLVIDGGHKDGARVRAIGLARLRGLYSSDAEAAKATGVDRTTIRRARETMQKKIKNVYARQKQAKNPLNAA